jgi:hypothetical protein
MLLTKEQILAANDRKFIEVQVPEWGENAVVRVGQLTAIQRDRWDSATYVDGKVNLEGMRARLCALCIVDADGQPLFTAEDVEALGQKSAPTINAVWTAAAQLNGMLPSSVDAIEKNSVAVQGGETSGN